MGLTIFLQQYLTGTSLGGAYTLIAIGYTLVCDALRLTNFAHGDIFIVAGCFTIFAMASLPWFTTIPVILIVIILLGVTIEQVAYRPLRPAPRVFIMISVIGVSHLLQNLATYLSTALFEEYLGIPFLKKIYRIGGLSISFITSLTLVLTLVLVYLLILLINHTKTDMAMRAVSRDYEIVSLMGIKIDKTITFTFTAGPLLVDIGSILYFTDRITVSPFSGVLPGLECLVAAVFGGIGNIPGAIIGDFILGLGETTLVAVGQSAFSDAFTFIPSIIMFLIRPTGLFGEKTTDKV